MCKIFIGIALVSYAKFVEIRVVQTTQQCSDFVTFYDTQNRQKLNISYPMLRFIAIWGGFFDLLYQIIAPIPTIKPKQNYILKTEEKKAVYNRENQSKKFVV